MGCMIDTLAPGFLIAVPQLTDGSFRQSVVLLLQQNEEGAMGVVINRESRILLSELCQDHEIPYGGSPEKRVRDGGPVQPEQGLVVYGPEHADPEGQPVTTGLHVSASKGTLSRLCNLPGCRFQCFAGYAGWGPGQLEREIQEGAWVVSGLDPSMVLDAPPEATWTGTLQAMGIDPAAMVPGDSEA